MYHIVRAIRPAGAGQGVIVDVQWFDQDPDADREIMPRLNDQITIPAPSPAAVTMDQLDQAIERRAAEIEAELSAAPPAADVAAIVGQPRTRRNGRLERTRRP